MDDLRKKLEEIKDNIERLKFYLDDINSVIDRRNHE